VNQVGRLMNLKLFLIWYIYYRPLFEELAGKTSVWGALSPTVQQVSFNVDSEFQNLFISKSTKATNLILPTI